MLELSGELTLGSSSKLSYGGDVLNTALYYSRLSGKVSFLTALGDDIFSDKMIDSWTDENIDTSLVVRIKDRVPGMYAIQTDPDGERSFHYWREQAPIKDLFYNLTSVQLKNYADEYQQLYFSGISLSRWNCQQLETFVDLLQLFKCSI